MPYCPHCGAEVAVAGNSCESCTDITERPTSDIKVQSGITNTIKQRTGLGSDVRAPLELRKTKSLGAPQQTLQQSEKEGWKGKLLLAVVLNVLWAGVGNMAVKAPKGGMIVGLNILAFILAIATGGVLAIANMALFFWATAIVYRHLRFSEAELKPESEPSETIVQPELEATSEPMPTSSSAETKEPDSDPTLEADSKPNPAIKSDNIGKTEFSHFRSTRWVISIILNLIWPGIGNLIFKQSVGILIAILYPLLVYVLAQEGNWNELLHYAWMIVSRFWAIAVLYRHIKRNFVTFIDPF